MLVKVKIHGVLSAAARVQNGPVEIEPDTTVEKFLCLIGLVDVAPALVVVGGHIARMQDVLSEGVEVSLLARVTGG